MSTPASRATAQPCLCLCLGLLQSTRMTPSRLITLQLGHIFLTDGRTFISLSLESFHGIGRSPTAPTCPGPPPGGGRNACRGDQRRERGPWPHSRAPP